MPKKLFTPEQILASYARLWEQPFWVDSRR